MPILTVFGLTQAVIKSKSTASVADAPYTRPLKIHAKGAQLTVLLIHFNRPCAAL